MVALQATKKTPFPQKEEDAKQKSKQISKPDAFTKKRHEENAAGVELALSL